VLIAMMSQAGLAPLAEPRFLRHPAARVVFTLVLVAPFSACLVWAAAYDGIYGG
jgi:hypothetical protein